MIKERIREAALALAKVDDRFEGLELIDPLSSELTERQEEVVTLACRVSNQYFMAIVAPAPREDNDGK